MVYVYEIRYNGKIVVIREEWTMKYINSINNEYVKKWKKLHMKKEREKTGVFLIEGFHLVEEALKGKIVETVLITEKTIIPTTWNLDNVSIVCVTDEIIKVLSEMETPQPIVAICEKR